MKTSAQSGIRCRVGRGIVGIQIESLSSTGYLEQWKYKEDSPRIDRTCEQQFNELCFALFFFPTRYGSRKRTVSYNFLKLTNGSLNRTDRLTNRL